MARLPPGLTHRSPVLHATIPWRVLVAPRPGHPCHLHYTVCAARKAKAPSQSELFQQHFCGVYGSRWPLLWQALQQPVAHAAYANPFCCAMSPTKPSLSTHSRGLTVADVLCQQQGWPPLVSPEWPFYHTSPGCTPTGVPAPPPQQLPGTQAPTAAAEQLPNGSSSSSSSPGLDGAATTLSHTAADPANGLRLLYFMDPASMLPALTLAPQPGMRVLDMCAAPGGKSLLLAALLFKPHPASQQLHEVPGAASSDQQSEQALPAPPRGPQASPPPQLSPPEGGLATNSSMDHSSSGGATTTSSSGRRLQHSDSSLVCNDRSSARAARLSAVLREYLPQEAHAHISVTSHDGTRWQQYEQAAYDAILLDAPCSSERHLALRHSPITREDWSPSRTQRNATTQLALLLSALQLLRPGGRLVYSTCSISPLENDGVVAKALRKSKVGVALVPVSEWWPQLKLKLAKGDRAKLPAHGVAAYAGGDDVAPQPPPAAAAAAGAPQPPPAAASTQAVEPAGAAAAGAAPGGDVVLGGQLTWLESIDATEYGLHALPDRSGVGPLYWAMLQRMG